MLNIKETVEKKRGSNLTVSQDEGVVTIENSMAESIKKWKKIKKQISKDGKEGAREYTKIKRELDQKFKCQNYMV